MKPAFWIKEPWEERLCEFDLTDALATGDSVASVSSAKVYDSAGVDQSATMVSGTPSISGNKVYVKIVGGTHDATYWAEIRVVTTLGDKIEDDLQIRVVDKRLAE